MIIKTNATTLNENDELLEPNSFIGVAIDLADLDNEELVNYCVEYLSVTRNEDIDIDSIDEADIIAYAEENLGLIDPSDFDLFHFSEREIIEHLNTYYNTVLFKPFYYPQNSIRVKMAYEKLLENIDKIPIEKVEELTKDL